MEFKRAILMITFSLLICCTVTGCQSREQKEAENAKETADRLRDNYENEKNDYNELGADIEKYNELQEQIKATVPGSSEYDRLVEENNALVNKLMDKYPDLKNYVTIK